MSVLEKCAVRSTYSFCAAITKVWQDCRRWLRDPYRPELHYMRGPGPKCEEKASRSLRT
jgi:hypothetical protein